ncbi:MAG: beta-xylosidase [Tepidisphaeraceae bacterium]|jgi:xylan 1,4-beta-xylosidase
MIRNLPPLIMAFMASLAVADVPASQPDLPVSIRVDAGKPIGQWKPAWRFFGYDEADFSFMPYGQKLLTELSQLQGPQVFIRCHHLLTSGDGTPALKWSSTNAYAEDAKGNPVYNWTITDRIFDAYVQRGLKPYAQIGFMPKDLSTRPDLYPTTFPSGKLTPVAGGQSYPPKDYEKWRNLVYAWVNHCVQRYGKSEVEKWYWEVWNEPNISYWHGTPEEYYKLYDYAVDGVRRALPTARVGGPEQAGGGGKFLRAFLQHCIDGDNLATGAKGSPLDFISFHAKGSPKFIDGHVRMGLSNQLNNVESGFATVAAFPQFKDTPIVIGESDPDGCAACTGPQLNYRNSTLYPCYTAAAFARTFEIADEHNVNLQGALTWAFEFEGERYFAGHRVLATNGIDLPVLNVFRMLAKLHGDRLPVESSSADSLASIEKTGVRAAPDVSAVAALDARQLAILLWNYHDDDVPGPTADIDLSISNLPPTAAGATLTEYRIDRSHSNAYTLWVQLGSPPHPTAEQYANLQSAGRLATLAPPNRIRLSQGNFALHVHLPRQGVSLMVLTFD